MRIITVGLFLAVVLVFSVLALETAEINGESGESSLDVAEETVSEEITSPAEREDSTIVGISEEREIVIEDISPEETPVTETEIIVERRDEETVSENPLTGDAVVELPVEEQEQAEEIIVNVPQEVTTKGGSGRGIKNIVVNVPRAPEVSIPETIAVTEEVQADIFDERVSDNVVREELVIDVLGNELLAETEPENTVEEISNLVILTRVRGFLAERVSFIREILTQIMSSPEENTVKEEPQEVTAEAISEEPPIEEPLSEQPEKQPEEPLADCNGKPCRKSHPPCYRIMDGNADFDVNRWERKHHVHAHHSAEGHTFYHRHVKVLVGDEVMIVTEQYVVQE